MKRPIGSRIEHFLYLVPGGVLVGGVVGWLFGEVGFGLLVGVCLGFFFGCLFTLRGW